MRHSLFLAFAMGCALASGMPAGTLQAQTRTIGTFGAWEAFGGTSQDGRSLCGVSTSWDDGRYFGVKYWRGEEHFTVQLIRQQWNIPEGTRIPMVIQFDQETPWNATASGFPTDNNAGSVVEFTVPADRLDDFLEEFRLANGAIVRFRSGNEAPWRLTLNGSNAASQAMIDCIERMGTGGGGQSTQPFSGGKSGR